MENLHPIVKKILIARGYKSEAQIEAFLNPSYDEHLHDPFLLKDIDKAVDRLKSAINRNENIVIYGDYDIDGLTATTLLMDYLGKVGARVTGYIPDRFEEGYGVNVDALKQLKKDGAQLIVTVDCGSKSIEALEWAQKNKLDVVVTDHHEVGDRLPPAVAIVNHKRHDDEYPFKDLAGCGVAFKLVQALQLKLDKSKRPADGREKWLLDLVAMGTVCDVVSLTGENRVLVKYGLHVLRKTPRLGIRALAAVSGVKIGELETYHLGYILGPRLNAAGRMEHAQKGLDLLNTNDKDEALKLAKYLDMLNNERRAEQDKIFRAAINQAEGYKDDPVLVLAAEDWSHGVVGIVASKLVEKYKKPTLLLQIMGEEAKGSARSFGDFNIVAGLDAAKDILEKHGGHFFAAGCTLKTKNIGVLRKKLNDFYKKQKLANQADKFELAHDAKIGELENLDDNLYAQLQKLSPFGMENNPPLLLVQNVSVVSVRLVGDEGRHLKLNLASNKGKSIDGIGFGLGHQHKTLNQDVNVKVWAELQENTYNGNRNLQLVIRKLQIME